MDSRKFVFKETAIVLLGEAVGTGAMFGVFAMLHAFNPGVLYGGLLGAFLSVLNFFVALSHFVCSGKKRLVFSHSPGGTPAVCPSGAVYGRVFQKVR